MEYKSYLLKIVGPGIDEYPNKHFPDDETAKEYAERIVERYPQGTSIRIFYVFDDENGRERKMLIGTVEH